MVQLVSSTGTVVKEYQYDAFGVEYTPDANDINYFRYCGQYFDTEIGTYYLRARYYDPTNGRFIQQDGWSYLNYNDPLSLNLYSYCSNNPIRYIDLSGTTAKDILSGLISALDENLTDGFVKWVISKIKNINGDYLYESEYDYYLGRVIGDAISVAIGAYMTATGIMTIISSISGGAAVTVGTGGAGAIGGVAICIEGVALGAATAELGASIVLAAAGNFGNDLSNMLSASDKISSSKKDLKPLDDKYLKNNGIDPHDFIREILKELDVKDKNISHYDILRNPVTKELYLVPKGNMPAIPTGEFLQ